MPKQKRAGKSPILTKAKFKFGKFLGIGQQRVLSKQVTAVEITEGGKKFHAAIKRPVFHREASNRKETARHQRVWRTFKKLGLPVPSFSRVYSRKPRSKTEGKKYLSIFMEDMTKKHGKIKETHEIGDPVEFDTLRANKDSRLIKDLAKDLATIHHTKYLTDHLDFWHFYNKKNGKRGRVILDFNGFRTPDSKREKKISIDTNLLLVRKNLGRKEWKMFKKEYDNHYNMYPLSTSRKNP